MVEKREAYAPWSLTRKAGVQSATVNGDIEVPQFIQPVLSTGFVDEEGNWKGSKSSDEQFIIDATHESVGNGASVLSPQATPDYIDMTGFSNLFIAIKPSNGGNVALEAVFGPATNAFANLTPIDSGRGVRIATDGEPSDEGVYSGFYDGSEALTTDVWNIYNIQGRLSDQKVLQFNITNNSGGASDIDFAYLRVV